jgi:hypothetical protein
MLARLLPVAVPPSVSPNPLPLIVPVFDSNMFPLVATMLLDPDSISKPL